MDTPIYNSENTCQKSFIRNKFFVIFCVFWYYPFTTWQNLDLDSFMRCEMDPSLKEAGAYLHYFWYWSTVLQPCDIYLPDKWNLMRTAWSDVRSAAMSGLSYHELHAARLSTLLQAASTVSVGLPLSRGQAHCVQGTLTACAHKTLLGCRYQVTLFAFP